MPLLDSLKAMFSHPQIKEEYFASINKHKQEDSFYTSNNFKSNELFSNHPNSIQIKLYMDDFGLADPLGDLKNDYKITTVYFKIGNLPAKFQSTNHFTQLALLCCPKVLKSLGYDVVFDQLINDIKLLETEGINIEYNGQTINLRGTISYLVADSLAANSIGGFIESFSSKVSGI